jgi:site-specific recombinase XerC
MSVQPPSPPLIPTSLVGFPLRLRAGVRLTLRRSQVVQPVGFVQWVMPYTVHPDAATRQQDAGSDVRTVEELLGHESVETTMMDTPVLQRGGRGGASPLDRG